MVTEPQSVPVNTPFTVKDLFTENPRWCVGCGDFGITMGLKRFLVDLQIQPHDTVNVSGIGCSGRAPNYFNTYGAHTIHGRPITFALGLSLTRPDLNIFVHSGDGDALSIGGNHLIHGVNKNFHCVFILYDNQLYALTKAQTSPTTRKGHPTMTQPQGTFMDPIKPVRLVLGIGGSFIARTADWMPDHLASTLKAAFAHKGFSFVHVLQRCPHYDPENFDHKTTTWFAFLKHEKGILPDKRLTEKVDLIEHDPLNLEEAFKLTQHDRVYFGLFYQNLNKPSYNEMIRKQITEAKQLERSKILDKYKI